MPMDARLVSGSLLALMTVTCIQEARCEDAFARISSSREIHLRMVLGQPFAEELANGSFKGANYEITKQVLNKIGDLSVYVSSGRPPVIISKLTRKEIDLAAGLYFSKDLCKTKMLSTPIFALKDAAVVHSRSR